MLYEKNSRKQLDDRLFKSPSKEYRGTPFWSWNCKLNKKLLTTQIEYLKEMGFGGFHIHSRTGMATEYLSDEFMDLVKTCVDKGEKEDMLTWLYDEDRWPSGAAGGLVTKDPKYRTRKLAFTPFERHDCGTKESGIQKGTPYLLSCYDIKLNQNGELDSYERIDAQQDATGEKWYAYVLTYGPDPWFNNQAYVDTLNKEAIDKFIEITYEGYKKSVGDKFGTTIPAIFTDEPQFNRKDTLPFATDKTEVSLPWTNDLTDTYQNTYHQDILDYLPELFWELPDHKISQTRYYFHDHVAERFANAFADNCGSWCEKNNLMLTGHMMAEESLWSQTAHLGEAMRSYRSFQLPGIDMLCNHIELTTAKQAQSASHQYGKEGVLSELYGVTAWEFDFRGHKFQGDWQAALGVTVRVPHLSWVSMEGEAKRDYPASINYQAPWYKEYSYIEDHFARVNTALTRGKAVVKVGVVHPVESYWLHWGPKSNTESIRSQMDNNFKNITKWLLQGQVDFDYISESLLPDLCPAPSNPLKVGEMEYTTIIVPGCETIRKTTLDRLIQFQKSGGRLIFVGECPKYVDAVETDQVKSIYDGSESVPFDHVSILSALTKERDIDIRNTDGALTNNLIYQLRQDHDCKWLFLAHTEYQVMSDAVEPQKVILKIVGEYTPTLYDTLNGEISEVEYELKNGNTIIYFDLNCHDSILLRLGEKTTNCLELKTVERTKVAEIDFKKKVSYSLAEPNVLLLDTAEYALDDEAFQETEEILKLDNKLREKLNWPYRQGHVAQPWTLEEEKIEHSIKLRFTINSEIEVQNPILAVENAENIKIELNGIPVENIITGYYVDESIKTIPLPTLQKGDNILTIDAPFGKRTNTEYCYILGDFHVRVEGCVKTITTPTNAIGFSSITNQGLPFYGGNITYQVEVETEDCTLGIKASRYRGALIGVAVDGKRVGVIAFAPYKIMVEDIKAGKHKIEFTLFGNRYNTFDSVHNIGHSQWHGPESWRTEGDSWCYEYNLKDTGILASPIIEIYKD